MRSQFSNMNEEQKNLAKGAKSKEELEGLLKSDKMKLSEDQLQKVNGGRGSKSLECPHPEVDKEWCRECEYLYVNGRKCWAANCGDAREGVDPNKVSKGLAEGRLTGDVFFA